MAHFPYFGASLVISLILVAGAVALAPGKTGEVVTQNILHHVDSNKPQTENSGCYGALPKQVKKLKPIQNKDACDICLSTAKQAAEDAFNFDRIREKVCAGNIGCALRLSAHMTEFDAADPSRYCTRLCVGQCIPNPLPAQYSPRFKELAAKLEAESKRHLAVYSKEKDYRPNEGEDGDIEEEPAINCAKCAKAMSKVGKTMAQKIVHGMCGCNGWGCYKDVFRPFCHAVTGPIALGANLVFTSTSTLGICSLVCGSDVVKGVVQGQD